MMLNRKSLGWSPFIVFSLLFIGSAQAAPFECQTVKKINQSVRLDCVVDTDLGPKTLHVLKLKGSYVETAYDHGYLLAKEAQNGVIHETMSRIERTLNKGKGLQKRLTYSLYRCHTDRILRSVTREFKKASREMARGMKDALGGAVRYDAKTILRATVAVELSNTLEGLLWKLEHQPLAGIAELGATCGLRIPFDMIGSIGRDLKQTIQPLKQGCLGVALPAKMTRGTDFLHARNFDADMVESWNSAPTLFYYDESDQPGGMKYLASASAGVVYAGGISGMNEAGISVSLHQMSTTKYKTWYAFGNANIAPFLQHQILRKARSIDEAVKLVKKSNHFAGWTILITDGKTQEVASIELSGDRVQVARRGRNASMIQTNHFLGSKMGDQAFSYNFNKKLETESRMSVARTRVRNRGSYAVLELLNLMSNHEDAHEGFRAYGRTATKAYTVMTTIAEPANNRFWLTLGERIPASHSHLLGFSLDWANNKVIPHEKMRTDAYNKLLNWEKSLEKYSYAMVAYKTDDYAKSLKLLNEAIELAKKDGIEELPYYFTRARLQRKMGRHSASLDDWDVLWKRINELHPYGQALVAGYSVVARDHLRNASKLNREVFSRDERIERLKFARQTLRTIAKDYDHFDLDAKRDWIKALQKNNAAKVDHPAMDFVTIE